MKIAVVVQRYGADINGGAELHARYVAEHLARHVQVEVLTTCATDYITWRNTLPEGVESIHRVTVRRFPVSRERDPGEFGRCSDQVFTKRHSLRDELAWLEAEGPTSPALVSYIVANEREFDFFIFFSFRYYHAFHGARAVPTKAILVPTAERDGALGLAMFGSVFRGVRALMYNSLEEQALIHAAAGNLAVPGVVVGIGSAIPGEFHPVRFRQKFNLWDRFAIYIGRIDENKGCAELFDYFVRYTRLLAEGLHLVLIGNPVIPVPEHPRIHHLGFVGDQDKFDALAAADLLVMPSYFESLSMVAIEAWALGKPVLSNGRCDVLKGQSIRSNGGLYYESFPEFVEALRALEWNPLVAAALGRNGRDFVTREYAWPVIERKYLDMLSRLKNEPASRSMEALPGWFARRRNDLAPANDVVVSLPRGPVTDEHRPAAPARAAAASEPRAGEDRGSPGTDRSPAPSPSHPRRGRPEERARQQPRIEAGSRTDQRRTVGGPGHRGRPRFLRRARRRPGGK
ncbi:MAG: glycosyltransferase family 4 protein [Acidobacteriota bacterium]